MKYSYQTNKRPTAVAALLKIAVVALSAAAFSSPASAWVSCKNVAADVYGELKTGAPCTNGPSFNFEAKAGYIQAADGVTIYSWGYTTVGSGQEVQYPGPNMVVTEGQTVTVALTNNLPTRTSMLFPGQSDVTAAGGSAGGVTFEVDPGQTITYSFIAKKPGTFMYHSGTQMDVQMDMGLFGALVIRPSANASRAYNHAATAFHRENVLILSEIDPERHISVKDQVDAQAASPAANFRVNTSAWSKYNPQYWFINGRNAPDTLAEAGDASFPHQPYSGLVRMHPGEKALLRVINAGRDLHPFHHHGNHTWAIAQDGRMLESVAGAGPDLARKDFTIRSIPGQTVDAFYEWTGAGLGWDVYGKKCTDNVIPHNLANCEPLEPFQDPLSIGIAPPTILPNSLELTYGEMFSGSHFLGTEAITALPVGAGRANISGGYFHMLHSHNEREIINGGVFPGGMMTMILIENWKVLIEN
jgi:manganese oxidase